MFAVADTHQIPLDEPFFTFSAMLQHANATPKPCTPKDNDRLFDNSFFNELQESNTISMEEILPFETHNQAGSCDDYDYSLDLFNSASLHGMFDTADAPMGWSVTAPNAFYSSLDRTKQRSYKELVEEALSDTSDGTMSLQELYDWLEKTGNTAGRPTKVWKNGIRQALRDDKVWLLELYATGTDGRAEIYQDGEWA
ncbi:hypothetical protein HBI68_249380 [Parastagonospora nodorum]|nr:hypothetical protein HBI51_246820 [Parastagonospora nodorum]KAH5983576.1 hypothetical protein HBI84_245480 [Parastagonospora nodorum]KAH6134170.1 hypothetical protein HBI68_249380 [Parastagonospora nodorum]KAH6380580.1 hypothetical protein HBI08_235040 [Parastagonospora nodorum]KAH6516999.1 hypothetical protein HBI07_247410 [Parastagonospora nodorum]